MAPPTPPGISVVIPTYNRAELVTRAIGSVLAQSMPDFELLVVDDGSTDDTLDRLAAICDARVRVIAQENSGVCSARNAGIRDAAGELVVWLDSDDEAEQGWLEFFENARRSGAKVASCGALMIEVQDGRQIVRPPEPGGPIFGNLTARFLAGAVAVDRQLLVELGGFRDGMRFSEHTELALRLGGRAIRDGLTSYTTDRPLVRSYRRDLPVDPGVRLESAMTILQADAEHVRRSRSFEATYLAIAGVAASKLGQRRQAVRLLAKAISRQPTRLVNWARLVRAAVSPHKSG